MEGEAEPPPTSLMRGHLLYKGEAFGLPFIGALSAARLTEGLPRQQNDIGTGHKKASVLR